MGGGVAGGIHRNTLEKRVTGCLATYDEVTRLLYYNYNKLYSGGKDRTDEGEEGGGCFTLQVKLI